MPRDILAEARQALELATQHTMDVRISPVMARVLLQRLTHLQKDNDTLRRQHATWHRYATTNMTAAQMDARLREIENETTTHHGQT